MLIASPASFQTGSGATLDAEQPTLGSAFIQLQIRASLIVDMARVSNQTGFLIRSVLVDYLPKQRI